jgi:GTP pyrophosphokinase
VGRGLLEKTLQREGKTAVNLEELAQKLGFAKVDDLFLSVAKEEFSLRHVEQALHEGEAKKPEIDDEASSPARAAHRASSRAPSRACWWSARTV